MREIDKKSCRAFIGDQLRHELYDVLKMPKGKGGFSVRVEGPITSMSGKFRVTLTTPRKRTLIHYLSQGWVMKCKARSNTFLQCLFRTDTLAKLLIPLAS